MGKRNLAIDIFRGLTVALMVCVNDFWAIHNVPHFLEHFAVMEDGMGLSDIIYPMFLFAMGMSVPLALERRFQKGLSFESTLKHILGRTLALLLMGSFIVNSETGIAWNKGVFWLLMVVGFFMVWNNYPEGFRYKRPLRILGIAILAGLAIAFRSPEDGLFRASWWGILGQIGWMYLFSAIAYILCRGRWWPLAILWMVFCLVNISVAPMRDGGELLGGNYLADFSDALHLGNGHSIIMALGGMICTLAGQKLKKRPLAAGFAAALVLALLAALTHKWWIISKGLGTLPWCLYVSAISVALYALLRALERRGLMCWARPLDPAGKATLTVYMMPYFFYSFWIFINPTVPGWMSGWVGVAKCAVFSALCIATAWGIGKLGIKLKI
ncbi:MAG: DUF5009 domain-containing protein [Bacteroidales bacterium]|nr:DUF5009 domain-containing protein [Bacteroidales bacterium]MBQ9530220.1 DUF5009 domain-containing protein [Bacteroidales bacterium]